MPKKTESQHLGEAGAASITSLLVKAGWSVDQVHSDYGEDLICQTFLNKQADPFRITIQVKSASSLRPATLERDHVIKWMCSLDLMVIGFWDDSNSNAYYFIPDHYWNLSEVVFSKNKSFRITIPMWTPLTNLEITRLEWISRFRGTNMLHLHNKSHLENLDPDDPLVPIENMQSKILESDVYLISNMLLYLDLATKHNYEGISFDTRLILSLIYEIKLEITKTVQPNLPDKPGWDDLVDAGLGVRESLLLCILLRASQIAPNVGIPGSILGDMVDLLYVGLKQFVIENSNEETTSIEQGFDSFPMLRI
jgi:hypothetical protein